MVAVSFVFVCVFVSPANASYRKQGREQEDPDGPGRSAEKS